MMKKIIYFLLLTTTLFAMEAKEVLLLHSYNQGLKWSDGITKGVKSIFDKDGRYELSIEYMDSKKIDSKEYFDNLIRLYYSKFKDRKYELIITADNYAFEFALSHQKDIFNNASIVFCGVENLNISKNKNENFIGVVEYKEIKKNIELIKEMIKDLKNLYIISDNSFSSQAIKNQILKATKKFENDFTIIFDNKINMDTLNFKIEKLPKNNSAVLFTSLYKDIKQRYVSYNYLRELFKTSKVPIFALNKIHLGEGVVGGMMINPFEQGSIAAKKAIKLLSKDTIKEKITIPTSKYYFDYKVLEKYNLRNSNFPTLSTLINKPKSFFEKYRKFIDSAFLLMPLLIFLIVGLIINIVKKIKLQIKLVEQNKLDSVLLNNINEVIYWKSNENILLGCNDAFYKLLSLPKEEIINQNIKKLLPTLYEKLHKDENFIEELEIPLELRGEKRVFFVRRKRYFNKKNEPAGVVTIMSDITNIKKLQMQKKKNEQFIIQRSKLSEVGEMMTSIAHQWKNPLIEISTIAQELLYKKDKKEFTKQHNKKFVDEIMTQVQYMTKTIDDFRNFIKPSLKKSQVDVKLAIFELLKVIEHNMKYNYINVVVNYKNSEKYLINGYANELKQAILSIINNSRDSILKKRKISDFEAKIQIDISQNEEKLYINIKDNGLGIKEDNLEKIFEPFFTTKENGDGFGLYLVRLIIEDKMLGKIEAISSKKGAEILISLEKEKKGLFK